MGKFRAYDSDGKLQEFEPISKDGSVTFTRDQPMGGKKLLNVGQATAVGDALSLLAGAARGDLFSVDNAGKEIRLPRGEAGKVLNCAANDIEYATLNGVQLKEVVADNTIGGILVIHQIDIAAGALGDKDVVLTHKTRVIDVWLILRGAGVASTTLQVKNGANAITDAMAASGSDQALVRAATIDDAYHEIAAGGTLRVTSASGATQPAATVYVLGFRVY